MSEGSSSNKEGETLVINNEEVRMVMVGKTGAGKSATGNTIMGFKAFDSKMQVESLTTTCKKVRGPVSGRDVAIVDTPGLFDTKLSEEETFQEVQQCINFSSPGPHVFLIVIKLGRFTQEEERTVEMLQKGFGEMSKKYTMIIFTAADQVDEDQSVEDVLKESPKLQELIRKCEGRYHLFNNKTKDRSQVTELLEKINNMVQENGGSHYTTEMFQDAERQIQAEKERILKEREEEIRKEQEKVKQKFEAIYNKQRKEDQRKAKEAHAREMQELKEKHERKAREEAEQRAASRGGGRPICTIL